METVLIIIAIVVVLGAVGGTALLAPRRRARRQVSGPDGQDATGAAGTGTLEAPPGAAGESGTGTVAPPDVSAPKAPTVKPRPVEQPPPSAGRLVRLRGRLARSQSALGSVLLNLLSTSALDDQAWEEIEDTLITADMGVTPARQIVERLRTEVKVTGTRDVNEVRAL